MLNNDQIKLLRFKVWNLKSKVPNTVRETNHEIFSLGHRKQNFLCSKSYTFIFNYMFMPLCRYVHECRSLRRPEELDPGAPGSQL